MSDSEHDDELEAYLKRRAPGRLGQPDRLEPPPELDRIIIGNARKAIQGTPPVPIYRAPKWALPAALAATIVISFAVVLELGLRTHQTAPEPEPIDTEIVADAPLITETPAMAAPQTKPVARLRLPAIPTDPWPPVAASNASPTTDAAQPQADEKARTRLARVEVAESRSRADANSSEEVIVTGPAPSHHARTAHLDPATWVHEIEKLHSAGRMAEVEWEIKRFRDAYPAYPLPTQAAAADARGYSR